MRKLAMAAGLVGVFGGLAGVARAEGEPFKVDPVHSNVIFRVKHLDVSYFYGRFRDYSGSFNLADSDKGGMIDIEVKAESVDTRTEKLDNHLKSADFFNTKEFPNIRFKSTSIKPVEGKDNEFEVTGDLDLHGVTKPITVKVEKSGEGTDPWGGTRCGFETVFTIKRSDYGMDFMTDKLGDEVRLTVSIEGAKK